MFSHVTEHKHRSRPVSASLTCLLRMKSRFPLSRQNFSPRSDTEEDVRTHTEEPSRSISGCSSVAHTDVPGSKVRVSQGTDIDEDGEGMRAAEEPWSKATESEGREEQGNKGNKGEQRRVEKNTKEVKRRGDNTKEDRGE